MLIGRLLIHKGLLGESGLEQALNEQRSSPDLKLGAILIRQGQISEASLYQALAAQLEFPIWQGSEQTGVLLAAAELMRAGQGLSANLAQRWQAFVSETTGDQPGTLLLVAKDPLVPELLEFVERLHAGRQISFMLAMSHDLDSALKFLHEDSGAASGSGQRKPGSATTDLRQLAQDAPIVEFVATMLSRGTDQSASDIHLEPTESGFQIRYRVDGQLRTNENHGRERFDAVISRIKLVSGLDIAERRLPQDGRFSTRAAGIETEVRVSVIPGVHGESIVMRLLPKTAHRRFKLDSLGFESDHLIALQTSLQEPDGIILVTGPTGSGKSTTLYAALAATDTQSTRVLTVEDPVEYQLPGITQFQVQSDIGFTFPAALRAILRHDPDTIMIGEIRDAETAGIAIQAALTGHKVLSTLHTNDAASAFVRLIDIGVEPFLLAASVRTVIAQRLIRRLCKHCAAPLSFADLNSGLRRMAEQLNLAKDLFQAKKPIGCTECSGSGYKGRVGVHEVLTVSPQLRHALTTPGLSDHAVRLHAPPGFRSLQQDALLKLWRGETSAEEVLSLAGHAQHTPPAGSLVA